MNEQWLLLFLGAFLVVAAASAIGSILALWLWMERHTATTEQGRVIYQLWKIIDDIDTAGDMAKSDDKAYRHLVERYQRRRWNVLDEKTVDELYERYQGSE